MSRRAIAMLACAMLIGLLASGCAATKKEHTPVPLSGIQQIDSFRPEVACGQAVEVVSNNPYSQDFFEEVFAKLIKQCESSRSPENADIIWNHFVEPLRKTGKVPEDLAVTTWNYYFSNHFASLPDRGGVENHCYRLADIKENMEKEYRLKIEGFAAARQGSPDSHFLNAMYVYNTMWAACNPQ
jgi:hypothetical protein